MQFAIVIHSVYNGIRGEGYEMRMPAMRRIYGTPGKRYGHGMYLPELRIYLPCLQRNRQSDQKE